MGRVVFGKNAEPEKWFRMESLLQDIAAHQSPDRSIVPRRPRQSIHRIPHQTDPASLRCHLIQTFSSPLSLSRPISIVLTGSPAISL